MCPLPGAAGRIESWRAARLTASCLDKEQSPPRHIKSLLEAFDRPSDRGAVILGIRLGRSVMLTVQHFRKCRRRCTRKQRHEVLSESRMREICMSASMMFRPKGSVSEAKGQVPLQTSAEFVRTYNSQAHE